MERDVSSATKTALFRIVQEALTNVVKHAVANTAKITMTFEDDGVSIKVIDDGQGFEPESNRTGKRISWGLEYGRTRQPSGWQVESNIPSRRWYKGRSDYSLQWDGNGGPG